MAIKMKILVSSDGGSLFLISEYGNITRNSEFYAEKYFEAYPYLLTEKSFDGSIDTNYRCYSVRTFERFLEYFGFTESTEEKLLDCFVKKTDFLGGVIYFLHTILYNLFMRLRFNN